MIFNMENVLTNYTIYQTVKDENVTEIEGTISNFTDGSTAQNLTIPLEDIIDNVWLWTIVDGLLMIAILCGNTLTILAVTLSRRLSNLISNQFVLNLAISDLTVGLTLPYHLAFYLDIGLGKMKATCVLRFILITLACCASILNLIAIAVDRYIAILHPLHYSRYMSKTMTRAMMAVGWTVAVSLSVVPIFWNNWGMASSCDMHKVIPKEYTTNVLAPMFSMIWVVMLVLYWRIWREAALHAKRMRTTTCCPAGPNDWKSVQVVLMVLGSFSLCWMPYVAVVCAQAMGIYSPQNQILYKAAFSLAVANSGINPLIYAWKNTGFRRAFLRLLRCKNPDCNEIERCYRAPTSHTTPDRKLPLETINCKEQNNITPVHAETTVIEDSTDKDTKVLVKRDDEGGVKNVATTNNNNSKAVERCHIIENLVYDDGLSDGASRCHIIENMGFDDSDRDTRVGPSVCDSDNDSVATIPVENYVCGDANASHETSKKMQHF